MLPFETKQHARAIFTKVMAGWLSAKGSVPGEAETAGLADASVRIANQFSQLVATRAVQEVPSTSSSVLVTKSLTFAELVQEWHRHATITWKQTERLKVLNRFDRYLFPTLGSRPASEVKPPELVAALRGVEDAGHLALAHQILHQTRRVYRFAIASGYALHDPAANIRGALYPWKPRHRATILLPDRVGDLLRAIASYSGYTTSKYMLRLLPLVFVRPSELREAEWTEIDFKASVWRIPARRMKARRPHVVPLSRQARAIFRQVHRITGGGKYVFASHMSKDGIISIHLSTTMLQSVGFAGEMTMSGFRSMASTLLNEQGWNPHAIDRQLSHQDPRPIRRSYNFAEYMPERRRMMQAWADYLDKLTLRPTGRGPTVP